MDTLPSLPSLKTNVLPSIYVRLLGRQITCMTVQATVEKIIRSCNEKRQLQVAYYNVFSFNLSMQLPWFYNFQESAEITLCDSMGVLGAIRYMGLNLPIDYRVSYTLLMPELFTALNWNKLSVFLLGARPEFLQAALRNTHALYPDIRIDGHHGYFHAKDPNQNRAVINQINRAQPDVLIVGMGQPNQENWLYLNRNQVDATVTMACGAAIDRLAGVVPECPALLSNVGLEWVYRLSREPKRLGVRYLLGNPAFALHIALARTSPYYAGELLDVHADEALIRS